MIHIPVSCPLRLLRCAGREGELVRVKPGSADPERSVRMSSSLAHDVVSVRIPHVLIRRVSSAHRRDAMFARLGAGDAPVPVVVPQFQSVR